MEREKLLIAGVALGVAVVLMLQFSGDAASNEPALSDYSWTVPNVSYPSAGDHPDAFVAVSRRGGQQDVYSLLRPNVSGWVSAADRSYYVETNEKGLREEPFALNPPEGTTRVLVVGDSFTFGWGVNRSYRYTDVLERKLNEEREGRYQVITAAVPGWGMKDYKDFISSRGVFYRPDMVVVAFNRNDVVSRQAEVRMYTDVNKLTNSTERGVVFPRVMERKQEYIREKGMESGLFSNMSAILAEGEKNGFKTIFYSYYPFRGEQRERIRQWAGENNATFVSAPDEIVEREMEEYSLSQYDRHYNEVGHMFLAKKLYEQVSWKRMAAETLRKPYNRSLLVSEDPLFESIIRGEESMGMSMGMSRGIDVSERFNEQRGAWRFDGVAYGGPAGDNRTFLILHPWSPTKTPADAQASSVSQQVWLPPGGNYTAVMAASNARLSGSTESSLCHDSLASVEVRSVRHPRNVKRRLRIVENTTEIIAMDVSDFSGETVSLTGKADAGNAGCGIWRSEFTEIEALFIAASEENASLIFREVVGERRPGDVS